MNPNAAQIELDVSDAERHAFTLSALDKSGAWIDEIEVFGSETEARKAAEKLTRETGLPLVTRYMHPGLG